MSGGKDSVYMAGLLKQRYPNVHMVAVMADTGFEHVKPVDAQTWAKQRCDALGIPLYVVRNPNKTYLEMVEGRGKFPSPKQRQCTSDLKRGPVQTWIRRAVKSGLIREKHIINCMGLRATESANRAKAKVFSKNKALSKAGRHVYDWLPIHKASLADVLNWHRDSRTPLHAVYVPEYHWDGTTGGYLRRFSCRLCIFATKADIHAVYRNDRDAFDRVAALEEKINFTMKPSESLVQIISQPLIDSAQYGSEELADKPCM
jgi:3'-phosphoadenosine 5'-phosphosulfate sulfotransferase (PAPS reductase)/FAD synthetase